jgi:hypothetical protein
MYSVGMDSADTGRSLEICATEFDEWLYERRRLNFKEDRNELFEEDSEIIEKFEDLFGGFGIL